MGPGPKDLKNAERMLSEARSVGQRFTDLGSRLERYNSETLAALFGTTVGATALGLFAFYQLHPGMVPFLLAAGSVAGGVIGLWVRRSRPYTPDASDARARLEELLARKELLLRKDVPEHLKVAYWRTVQELIEHGYGMPTRFRIENIPGMKSGGDAAEMVQSPAPPQPELDPEASAQIPINTERRLRAETTTDKDRRHG